MSGAVVTIHLPSNLDPAKPLCGRVLSRNQPLTLRDQRTMDTSPQTPAEGFAVASAKQPRVCRHCQRVAGLLPKLTRPGRDSEGEVEEPWACPECGEEICECGDEEYP